MGTVKEILLAWLRKMADRLLFIASATLDRWALDSEQLRKQLH